MTTTDMDEGGKCPECDGVMGFPKVENCSCHITAPCGACTSVKLTCDKCGWEQQERTPEIIERHIGGGISERFIKNTRTDLGGGKVLLDYDYDSSSGSTMVWSGRYQGPVTPEDIIAYFGDGTFGHRGPSIGGGKFSYTKITD